MNYLNAHYCETEEEETTTLDGKISNEESTTLNGEISIEGYTTTTETIANNEKEYEKVKKEEKENETTTLKSEIPTEKTLAINMESFLIEENTKYSIIEKNENKLLINNSLKEPGNDNLNKIVYSDINFKPKDNNDN